MPGRSRPEACPHCGSPLADAQGRVLRPIDLDYDALAAALETRSRARVREAPYVALALALLGLVPPVAPFAIVALGIAQWVWVRWRIARHYARNFSPGRRLVTRWVSRLGLVFAGGLHLVGVVPFVQIVVSPLVFTGCSFLAWRYFRFHLGRERRREPIHALEKILLVVLGIVVAISVALFVLFAGLAAMLMQALRGS